MWGVGEDRPVPGTHRCLYYNTDSPQSFRIGERFRALRIIPGMPVIVVGADSELGEAVIARLQTRAGEVRAFVSDPTVSQRFRLQGIKVAIGDVSDLSHVAAASAGAFSAILITAAATDGRETAFADPRQVVEGWLAAIAAAGVSRIILVGEMSTPVSPRGVELALVPTAGRSPAEVAEEVAGLDDA